MGWSVMTSKTARHHEKGDGMFTFSTLRKMMAVWAMSQSMLSESSHQSRSSEVMAKSFLRSCSSFSRLAVFFIAPYPIVPVTTRKMAKTIAMDPYVLLSQDLHLPRFEPQEIL